MEIKSLLLFLVAVVFIFLLTNSMIFGMVKSICDESEVQPVRYELGGLFGNVKVPIPTTESNADGYEKVCIKSGKPTFWSITDNVEYLVTKTRDANFEQGGESQ